jgi:cAMP-dependent protein kinase regulator
VRDGFHEHTARFFFSSTTGSGLILTEFTVESDGLGDDTEGFAAQRDSNTIGKIKSEKNQTPSESKMGCKPSKTAPLGGTSAPLVAKLGEGHPQTPDAPTEAEGRKRRAGVSAQTLSPEEMKDWKRPVHHKSDESKALLKKIISSNPRLQLVFGNLNSQQVDDVILAMFPRDVPSGETVIKQGETGDAMWIVESGAFYIFVNKTQTPGLGDKVFTAGSGAMFGELALMYNAPRAATVVASEAGRVWGLDAVSFKMMIVTAEDSKKKRYESFLGKVSILADLDAYERASLSDVIDVAEFESGEVVMKQGDAGNNFYILESGDAKACISIDGQAEVLAKHYTQAGEYFGELALLLASPRKATVYAGNSGCVLLYVSKEKFDRVLGPIKHRLKIENYPQYADIIQQAKEAGDTVPQDDED